jgi:release factor glutamine methyltransferase
LELRVSPDVLIPRPETEHLVEVALSQMQKSSSLRILELGTGSGAISIALAFERPEHRYIAVDRSINAVKVAGENARQHHVEDRIGFFVGEWFQSLNDHIHLFDMIVSNPPYIKTGDIGALQPEIYEYEPYLALDGGEDGLQWIRHIIFHAPGYLKPQGILILEIGHDQKEAICRIIAPLTWYKQVEFIRDYSGHHRIVQIRKKNRS